MRFLTEKILWSQIREGDMSAFEELFNLYADSLLAYGMKFTPDREQVKDIIQDLFVRIIKRHDSLPEVENVKAYLLQTTSSITFLQIGCARSTRTTCCGNRPRTTSWRRSTTIVPTTTCSAAIYASARRYPRSLHTRKRSSTCAMCRSSPPPTSHGCSASMCSRCATISTGSSWV